MPTRVSPMRALVLALAWGACVLPPASALYTHFCDYNFGANSSGLHLNIEETMTERVSAMCHSDEMREFKESYPTAGVWTGFVSQDEVLGESFAQGLEVQFDIYLELLKKNSTKLELLRLDSPWVDPLSEDLVNLDGLVDTSGIAPHWQHIDAHNRTVAVVIHPSRQVLYFREDLFAKWGHTFPNGSWDEFEEVVRDIQQKERAERGPGSTFWGFCLPSRRDANEISLNLVSLLSGHPWGGSIVEPDGTVSINNAAAARAVDRWASWVGDIMPPECMNFGASAAENMIKSDQVLVSAGWTFWHSGVMQHWSRDNAPKKIAAGPFPGPSGAGCAGEWNMAMSRHTRQQRTAADWLQLAAHLGPNLWRGEVSTEPVDSATRTDPDLWKDYCGRHTLLCESIERYPEFWGRLVHRPTKGTGSLYPQALQIISRNVYDAFSGRPGAEVVLSMEQDLKVLLGHVSDTVYEGESEGLSATRAALIASAVAALALALALAWVVRRGYSRMRKTSGPTIPVSIALGLVVVATLTPVLTIVVSDTSKSTRNLSESLSHAVRVQSLRMVSGSLSRKLEGTAGSSESAVRDLTVAKMKSDLGSMQLDPRTLVILMDRMGTREIAVSSDRRRQEERVALSAEHNPSRAGVHPWVEALISATPEWDEVGTAYDESSTLVLQSGGKTLHVNRMVVESRHAGSTRHISFLVTYFTPEEVFMEEPDRAMEGSLEIAVALSLMSVALTAAAAVAVTQPLVSLAEDMETVRLMAMENLRTGTRSAVTELSALLAGFRAMSEMISEYKTYLPKTVFIDSETDADEGGEKHLVGRLHSEAGMARGVDSVSNSSRTRSGSGGGGGRFSISNSDTRSSASKAVSIAFRKTAMDVSSKMRGAKGVCMAFNLADEHSVLSEAANPQGVVADILTLAEEIAAPHRGVLHQFSASSPTSILVTWGIVAGDSSFHERAAEAAAYMSHRLSEAGSTALGGKRFSISLCGGRCKAGNVGTRTTRGFAFFGDICSRLGVLAGVAAEFAREASLVVCDAALGERISHAYALRSIAITPTGRVVQELRGRIQDSEDWMYDVAPSGAPHEGRGVSGTDPLTSAVSAVASDCGAAAAAVESLRELQHSEPDDVVLATAIGRLLVLAKRGGAEVAAYSVV